MGEEESKDNLISFLNAVLDADDKKKLVSIDIIDNKELTKELIFDKTGRLDVRARTADGMQIDIEVQLTNRNNMEKRTMFYWGKLFLEGIRKGDDYINLKKVITINILDFDFLDIDKFHSQYHLWEDGEDNYLLTDLVEIHFIEMPKFRRFMGRDLKGNSLHRWLAFFDLMLSESDLKELIEMDSAIKRAEMKLEYLGSDEQTLALYNAREDSLHDRANMISSAKAEGKTEKAVEVTRKLLFLNLPVSAISEATELTVEKIEEIKNILMN